MTLIRKKNTPKSTQTIIDDIKYSFYKITSQNTPIYAITITNTDCKTTEELRFYLTNKLFNKIHKDYKQSLEVLNYSFVIEYPTKVSMGNQLPDNCEVHTHIILGTTISKENIEYYIQTTFRNPDIFIEDITKRDDKMNYANYLIKQKHLLTDDNYNYKIKLPK
ncbi:hypothetical protein NLG42_11185 [Flavobacterium plurextorum]|uniref:hypothetical protein n=1 Tax=Flavobacterium TaxID=237 RepID=UPI00214D51BA|nr:MULTISPECIES: hypothetical protein [Flavobacterium]UUW11347.1 hypothetical protein NLG42_11185 [Flavobacterium plurextorum]